jgi:hypothetical protein
LFRYRDLTHHPGMATLAQKIKCEQKVRAMIESSGLPEPDEIEYGYTCIWVIWEEPKLALRIDIDTDPETATASDARS